MSTVKLFTPDQEEIRAVARQFLGRQAGSAWLRGWIENRGAGEDSVWEQMAELGWLGIAISEDQGGAGYGFIERAILLEETGRVLLPLPFFSSAVLAADLLTAVSHEADAALLGDVAAGSKRPAVVAHGDLLGSSEPTGGVRASGGSEDWRLSGEAGVVIDAPGADVLLVLAQAQGAPGLFAVAGDASRLDRTPLDLLDATRPAASVSFADTPARRLDRSAALGATIEAVFNKAAVSLAAEMIGGAGRCLEMTLAYVKDREQFGVAIGSFQALKHRLADLFVCVDTARELVYGAARVAAEDDAPTLRVSAAAAKVAANEAFLRAAEETIQLHGGIGFTWEHDAHLYYKRALVVSRMLGSTTYHLNRVAVEMGV